MSSFTENLQTIYQTKLEIKDVIGTSSDVFTEYPQLIQQKISQGGGGQGADYYWYPDSENEPTTYYPFVEVTDEGDGSKHYSYSLGNLAETNESAAVFANINTDRFNWNGFLYFDPFEVSSETVAGYKESRPIQLVRSSCEGGPDKSGGINLVETTLTNATLEIANDDLGFPVIILTNGE